MDLGCGVGYGTNILIEKNKKIYGLDINKNAIEFARENYSNNIIFDVGNAEYLPYKCDFFDAICSFEVIEHIKKPDKFLSEINRVMRNNGIFVLSTPNRPVFSPNGIKSPYHIREYSYEELYNLLKKYFHNIKIFGLSKSNNFDISYNYFLKSQNVRQNIVNIDILNIRKLIPKSIKEYMWILIGNLFGRNVQESLTYKDFSITNSNLDKSDNIIAVCKKLL